MGDDVPGVVWKPRVIAQLDRDRRRRGVKCPAAIGVQIDLGKVDIEDESDQFRPSFHPNAAMRQRAVILGSNLLAIDGVLETDGDVHHLIADRVHDFSQLADGLCSKSRDFC